MAASLFKWLSVILFLGYPVKLRYPANLRHPLYVSVTEVNHNAKDKTLEISCKIFTNDFEAALEKNSHVKVDLSKPSDKAAADKLVAEYILKHLQFAADGKSVPMQFVGSEKETDATWSYFQVNNLAEVKTLEITNTLLYEIYPGEINIMHVSVGGNHKSSKVTNPEAKAVFSF